MLTDEMIERMKSNKIAFGLLDSDMRAAFEEVGPEKCEEFQDDGCWLGCNNDDNFDLDCNYRLHKDYEQEAAGYEEYKNELKPCPCCKGKAGITKQNTYTEHRFIQCEKCLLRTDSSESLELIVEDWNTRPDSWLEYPENKPEKEGIFLVTHKLGFMDRSDWAFRQVQLKSYVNASFGKYDRYIIAFMPLPAPYEEE